MGSVSDNKRTIEPFLGFELLLFRRFQQQPSLWYEWRTNLSRRASHGTVKDLEAACTSGDSALQTLESLEELGVGDIHQDLWFLSVMVHRRPKNLLEFVEMEIERERCKRLPKYGETLMMRYLNLYNFTVLSLDSMFKFGDDNRLPREIFRCPNVKSLSLKYNSLEYLPCDIGRMSKLEYLALTNNKLSVWSLPYSLTFLTSLHTLYLDNNLLDALPGFLARMPKLETVHRHGNHNYFKSTFMWYHTDVNLRIIPFFSEAQCYSQYESLQFWAAKGIIGQKQNFFQDENVVPVLKDYIADIYHLFNICHNCNTACLSHTNELSGLALNLSLVDIPHPCVKFKNDPPHVFAGYKVITFKNPYLGNTCVPFQHWACSMECARAVEIPARLEQISAARELDLQYENYVRECVRKFSTYRSPRSMLSVAVGSRSGDSSDDSRRGKSTLSASSSESDDNSHFQFKVFDNDSSSSFSRRYHSKRWRNGRSSRGRLLPADSARTKCSCVIS
ncbi:leucine-rich repeat-containing protein 8e [Plakobranchus ocellatus]|uniref:Leucine-rich repeat-containing protein 8e n=1 Tax=Plakobranchus ocellatus TaxID=259542 RepID=A0AAV4CUI5_9GAST|nr:leucine-rich repeat-containing protein 8e [Plakobranchus ocellatus]